MWAVLAPSSGVVDSHRCYRTYPQNAGGSSVGVGATVRPLFPSGFLTKFQYADATDRWLVTTFDVHALALPFPRRRYKSFAGTDRTISTSTCLPSAKEQEFSRGFTDCSEFAGLNSSLDSPMHRTGLAVTTDAARSGAAH